MNKKIYLFRNIIYSINFVLILSFFFQISNMTKIAEYLILVACMIFLGILLIKNHMDKDKIRNNKKYNIVFALSNAIIFVILLRNYLDGNIPNGIERAFLTEPYFWERNTFFCYNIESILCIMIGLISTNILLHKKKN